MDHLLAGLALAGAQAYGLAGETPGMTESTLSVVRSFGAHYTGHATTLNSMLSEVIAPVTEPNATLLAEVSGSLGGQTDVDAVLETVGKATWSHSMKSLRPGGTLVVSGATTGADPSADLNRLFFLQLRVLGSTMGTRTELEAMLRLLAVSGVRPQVDEVVPLAEAHRGFERLVAGDVVGKVVLTP